jgi:hypothetical protein
VIDSLSFYPPHRLGLISQIIAILLLIIIGALGLWMTVRSPIGPGFLLYLIPVSLAFILIPLVSYRAYALWRAYYLLERDGIYLRWGLREEVIPMDSVTWVRMEQELGTNLPRPWFRWPGAILGSRALPDGTRVEYLAAQSNQLILVSSADRLFAISPSNPEEFMLTYHRFAELGSLTPLTGHSVYPANLLRRIWAAPYARYLLLAGLLASIIVLVLVSLYIPALTTISLRLTQDGSPTEKLPSVYMLLLPVLNGVIFFANTVLGLYLFRSDEQRTLAYLLWGSGLFTALLFLAAVIFVIRAG